MAVKRKKVSTKPKKKSFTPIDYTLEQYMEEKKRAENIIKTLEKIMKVIEKFEKKIILDDSEIRILKRKVKKLEKNKSKKLWMSFMCKNTIIDREKWRHGGNFTVVSKSPFPILFSLKNCKFWFLCKIVRVDWIGKMKYKLEIEYFLTCFVYDIFYRPIDTVYFLINAVYMSIIVAKMTMDEITKYDPDHPGRRISDFPNSFYQERIKHLKDIPDNT